jgi:NAD-dependent SIR2 family protein deacetylase
MEGGYVTTNCAECGKQEFLSEQEFLELGLWASCPSCKKRMKPEMIEKNYGYSCLNCQCKVLVSDLLPSWEDLL